VTFPRVVVPGCPHHVLHRGNRKQNIFFDDSDRLVYLRLMHDACDTGDNPLVPQITNWSEWLKLDSDVTTDIMRCHTATGRPLGSTDFLIRIGDQIGRNLLPKKRGPRPRPRHDGADKTDPYLAN
jgi:hypothetical protein